MEIFLQALTGSDKMERAMAMIKNSASSLDAALVNMFEAHSLAVGEIQMEDLGGQVLDKIGRDMASVRDAHKDIMAKLTLAQVEVSFTGWEQRSAFCAIVTMASRVLEQFPAGFATY